MKKGISTPRKPAFRWHGGKWRLSSWLLKYMPAHDHYVEPYGGSAALLLQKPRSAMETYNDLDFSVVNFFQCLRDNWQALEEAITFTPYSEAEWLKAWAHIETESILPPIESARRFYVRSMMSIAAPSVSWQNAWRRQKVLSKGSSGFSSPMKPAAKSFAETDHLYDLAMRLRGVQIENDGALNVITRYDHPETLFYVDPPYVLGTRSTKRDAYAFEMDDDDHGFMASILKNCSAMIMLSGYESKLYEELFPNWPWFKKSSRINGPGEREEILWLNPHAANRLAETPSQLALLPH